MGNWMAMTVRDSDNDVHFRTFWYLLDVLDFIIYNEVVVDLWCFC